MSAAADHALRAQRLAAQLREQPAGAPLALAKTASNPFRDRAGGARRRLDLRAFDHVLAVDAAGGWVETEGLATFEALVDATLPLGTMPAVVPQLKTITLGGAAAGVGIEATSFRQGLVHDTLLELDVLLPGGEIVRCTPDNEHRDLFLGFPNSYGTLGYALRLRQRTIPVRPFVQVRHLHHADPESFFDALARHCEGSAGSIGSAPPEAIPPGAADFVEGVAFDPRELVLSVARFEDAAPRTSDYGVERVYWRSLRQQSVDHLRTRDWLWRWETDWFWCSRRLGMQWRPLARLGVEWMPLRRLLGPERLGSRTYTRLMRLDARLGLSHRLDRLRGLHAESVTQDIDIPLARATEFLRFLLREVGILPVWLCPLRASALPSTLYPLEPGSTYVNFGFWATVRTREARAPDLLNRRIEHEAMRLGGLKSLYSDSFFDREEFDAAYGMARYEALKARYDPQQRALGLYEKCVLRG